MSCLSCLGCAPSVPEGAPVADLDHLVSVVQTGDVVLLAGPGWTSDMIRMATLNKNWSHTALIVVFRGPNGERYVCMGESDLDANGVDVMTGAAKGGPQVLPFRERIASDKGTVFAVKRLRVNHPDEESVRHRWTELFVDFFYKHGASAKYDLNLPRMTASVRRGNVGDPGNYICTQFVADALVHMGALLRTQYAENYTLDDFSRIGEIPLAPGLRFEDPVYIRK